MTGKQGSSPESFVREIKRQIRRKFGVEKKIRIVTAIQARKSYLRPLPQTDLDLVFSLHYERRVKKDGTFSFRSQEYNLRQCAGAMVTLCLIPKQKLLVAWNGQKVGDFSL